MHVFLHVNIAIDVASNTNILAKILRNVFSLNWLITGEVGIYPL